MGSIGVGIYRNTETLGDRAVLLDGSAKIRILGVSELK